MPAQLAGAEAVKHLEKRLCAITKATYDLSSPERPYMKAMTEAFITGVKRVRSI